MGCADGDMALGPYASLRNEAFTIQRVKQPSDGRWVQMALMPPNAGDTVGCYDVLQFRRCVSS